MEIKHRRLPVELPRATEEQARAIGVAAGGGIEHTVGDDRRDLERAVPHDDRRALLTLGDDDRATALRQRCLVQPGPVERERPALELSDKYRELVAPVLDDAAAARLLDCLWRLDALDDVAELPFPPAATPSAPRR